MVRTVRSADLSLQKDCEQPKMVLMKSLCIEVILGVMIPLVLWWGLLPCQSDCSFQFSVFFCYASDILCSIAICWSCCSWQLPLSCGVTGSLQYPMRVSSHLMQGHALPPASQYQRRVSSEPGYCQTARFQCHSCQDQSF
jgi:hypothetical protein